MLKMQICHFWHCTLHFAPTLPSRDLWSYLLGLSPRPGPGQPETRGRHLEGNGGRSHVAGSKFIPLLLPKGERTAAWVSGAEISFIRLTPLEGRLDSAQRSETLSPGMSDGLELREERRRNTHTHLGRQALMRSALEHVSVGRPSFIRCDET